MKPLLCFNSRWIFYSLYIQPRYSVTYSGLQRQYQLFFQSVFTRGILLLMVGKCFLACSICMAKGCCWLLRAGTRIRSLYSCLLHCLFFQEDPVRADVVLPHAQRQVSVHTWPGACSSAPPQELLCSVARCQLKLSLQDPLWLKTSYK